MKTTKNDSNDALIERMLHDLMSKQPVDSKSSQKPAKFKLSFSSLKLFLSLKIAALKDKIHLLTFSFKYYEGYAYNLLIIIYSSLLPNIRSKALFDLLTLINATPPSKRSALLMRYFHLPIIAVGTTKFSLGHYLLNALMNARESFSLKDPVNMAYVTSLRKYDLREEIIDSWLSVLYPYKSIHDDPHSFIPMMLIDPNMADLLLHDIKTMTEVINTESYLSGITDHVILMHKATPDIAEVVRLVFKLLSNSYLRVPASPLKHSASFAGWYDEVKAALKAGRIFKVK